MPTDLNIEAQIRHVGELIKNLPSDTLDSLVAQMIAERNKRKAKAKAVAKALKATAKKEARA